MPWQYATPETESTTFDAIRVESFEVLAINGPTPRLLVTYDRGAYDGETFTIYEEAQVVEIATSTVLALMATVPAGATLYDAIKTGVYDALHIDGVSPPGSLS